MAIHSLRCNFSDKTANEWQSDMWLEHELYNRRFLFLAFDDEVYSYILD